jgi:hypothetical protein
VLESPQHPTAAALGRIVVGDKEGMFHSLKPASPRREALSLVLLAASMDNSLVLSRSNPVLAALLGVAILLLTWVGPVHSQNPTPSPNPAIYTAQLREAVGLGRIALKAIEALPNDNSVPIDPKVLNDANSTYVLIRAARHGMSQHRERQKYPDPMLELAFQRIDHAWNLARVPIDSRGLPRHQYIPLASRDLAQALRLLDQALMLLP